LLFALNWVNKYSVSFICFSLLGLHYYVLDRIECLEHRVEHRA
jgi:hypothetical protein